MSKPVPRSGDAEMSSSYARLSETEKKECLAACRELTDHAYSGLDLRTEIQALHDQDLGDTVLLWGDAGLDGIAVCNCGQGSEASETNCLVKFGVVRGGPSAERDFNRLLDACEAFAATKGLSRLEAGVNLAHQEVYPIMIARGFRTDLQGVAMQSGNEAGYHRPGVYLIDDWR